VKSISGADTSYQNALSVSPVIDFRTSQGWGINYTPSIVTSGQRSGIYKHSFSLGYEQYGRKNHDLVFDYTHNFFTNKTSVPYSPLSNELFFLFASSASWVRPVIAAGAGFGKDNNNQSAFDIGLTGGISHAIKWTAADESSSFELTPAVLLNAGTNAYFSFLRVSKYIGRSHRYIKIVKKRGKSTSISSSSFELSNIELNLDSAIEFGGFSLRPGGSVFIPLAAGTGNSLFGYGELALQYSF
jgi:hypothetical protein